MTGGHVRYITSPLCPASAVNRNPIVPQGSAEKRIAFPMGEGERPAKGIAETDYCMHTATGYTCSVAVLRHGKLK